MDNHHAITGGITSHQSIPLLKMVKDPTDQMAINEVSSVLPIAILVLVPDLTMQAVRGTTIGAPVAMDPEVRVGFRRMELIPALAITNSGKLRINGPHSVKANVIEAIKVAVPMNLVSVILHAMIAHPAVLSANLGTSNAMVARRAILIR
jgi:hypothetical protein